MSFSLGLAMLVSAAFGNNVALASTTVPNAIPLPQAYLPKAQTVHEYVSSYFADIPVMVDIAGCESKFRQFDKNGNVLRGDVPQDVGVMQVNEYYHGKEAANLGIDLYTIEGNVEFARYLYEKEGTTPWLSSSKCWKAVQAKELAANN